MRCPTCAGELKPWPWQDGGYKGVQCEGCGGQWWSESFADQAYEAARRALGRLMETESFPADAKTDAEYRKALDDVLDRSDS